MNFIRNLKLKKKLFITFGIIISMFMLVFLLVFGSVYKYNVSSNETNTYIIKQNSLLNAMSHHYKNSQNIKMNAIITLYTNSASNVDTLIENSKKEYDTYLKLLDEYSANVEANGIEDREKLQNLIDTSKAYKNDNDKILAYLQDDNLSYAMTVIGNSQYRSSSIETLMEEITTDFESFLLQQGEIKNQKFNSIFRESIIFLKIILIFFIIIYIIISIEN